MEEPETLQLLQQPKTLQPPKASMVSDPRAAPDPSALWQLRSPHSLNTSMVRDLQPGASPRAPQHHRAAISSP